MSDISDRLNKPGRPRSREPYTCHLASILLVYDELRLSPIAVKNLSDRFDLSKRTIYRYLRVFDGLGYNLVETNGKYQIKP